SISVTKVAEHALADGMMGVHMELQFQLTPLNVSFAGAITMREETCEATGVNGYFDTHRSLFTRSMTHDPAATALTGRTEAPWADVGQDHNLSVTDHAGLAIQYSRLNWPLTSGSFRWRIPDVYRINGGPQRRLTHRATQAFRMDADGTVTVYKGGQSASRPCPPVAQMAARHRAGAAGH